MATFMFSTNVPTGYELEEPGGGYRLSVEHSDSPRPLQDKDKVKAAWTLWLPTPTTSSGGRVTDKVITLTRISAKGVMSW